MINYQLPEDVSPKMDYLRELYNHSQLSGALIYKSEQLFAGAFRSSCEFAKAIFQQDEELAFYQFLASINALYQEESNNRQTLSIGMIISEESKKWAYDNL